jgi:hypothetical protein
MKNKRSKIIWPGSLKLRLAKRLENSLGQVQLCKEEEDRPFARRSYWFGFPRPAKRFAFIGAVNQESESLPHFQLWVSGDAGLPVKDAA